MKAFIYICLILSAKETKHFFSFSNSRISAKTSYFGQLLKSIFSLKRDTRPPTSDKAMTLENYFIWKNVLTSFHFGFLCRFSSLVATLHFLVKTTTTATRPPNFFCRISAPCSFLPPLVSLPCLYWDQFG